MGTKLILTAADGHTLGAYRADPAEPARGGVVVLQEIFGVNGHIRDVCDRFAREGYAAIAPALYDRSSLEDAELTILATMWPGAASFVKNSRGTIR